jgi:SPP1 family predicted phage head-tail adaptor
MGKIAAGRMNKRVAFQRKSATQDDWGQPVDTWTDVCTLWGNVRTPTGLNFIANEMQEGGTEVSRSAVSIRVRKASAVSNGIVHGMRALIGSTIYDIRAVLPDEEGDEYVDVACAVGASEG